MWSELPDAIQFIKLIKGLGIGPSLRWVTDVLAERLCHPGTYELVVNADPGVRARVRVRYIEVLAWAQRNLERARAQEASG